MLSLVLMPFAKPFSISVIELPALEKGTVLHYEASSHEKTSFAVGWAVDM